MFVKLFEFLSAVRGSHYLKKFYTKYLNVRTSQTTRITTLQRGLKISCKATIRMSDTIGNRNLIVKYSKIIELLHVEPSSPATIGSFLYKNNGNDNELYKINCR